MKTIFQAALVLLGLGAMSAAPAHTVIFENFLDGPSEDPPNPSLGVGFARATFDLDLLQMRVQALFTGLAGEVTAAHIHCCTAAPGEGTVGVATTTPTFTNFPSGVTNGSYDFTFDMTLPSSYNPAFVTAQGGTVSQAFDALLAGLTSGHAYFNIHTSSSPGGEIRGFLHEVAVVQPVPLPAALWLLAPAVAGLGLRARRQAA